jgi:hypothetical protein
MNVSNILLGVSVLTVLIFLYYYFTKKTFLTTVTDATVSKTISPNELPNPNDANSSNFTYAIWFYVNNWNYKYGEPKIVFSRMNADNMPCPSVSLDSMTNDLSVNMAVYPNETSSTSVVHNCKVTNVPLQKWVCLVLSMYGRSMDVYLDGKLVRTCPLPGVAKACNNVPVVITPGGGFSGYTSAFQFYNNASNPQDAYNIYRKGFGSNALSGVFNKFRIKIDVLDNNISKTSFEI